jgi:CubicO group peptidase (beta-lactamase class C family)
MAQTSPVITNATRGQLAIGYDALADDQRLPPDGGLAPATWLVSGCADGCIASTATDMAAYLRAWMTPGPVITDELIRTATEHTIPTDRTDPDLHHGYGWELCTIDGHRHFCYGGGMVGYSSYVVADRDARLGVVLLTNGPSDPERLTWEVLSLVRSERTGVTLSAMPRSGAHGTDALVTNPGADAADAETDPVASSSEDDPEDPLAGHWRSHNPWFTNFRTVRRDGRLLLISPGGVESPGDELELVGLGQNTYRLGEDERSPEQLSYAMFIDGRPHEVRLNGCPYYRSFV